MENQALAKRDCVSGCIVPLCSSIKCSDHEICILSSQTCAKCPSVSCVSMSLSSEDHSGSTSDTSTALARGAIAGIVIAVCVLLALVGLLIFKLRKRRKILKEINEKASIRYSLRDSFEHTHDPDSDKAVSRYPSEASIKIGLDSGIMKSLVPATIPENTPATGGDHFFSADDLMRISYAESMNSVPWTGTDHSATFVGDRGAAIMQANNPVVAVRAKAAVLQYTRRQSFMPVERTIMPVGGLEDELPSIASKQSLHGTSTLQKTSAHLASQSVWEEDSVPSSPVERELISAGRFNSSATSLEHNTQDQSQGTPTKSCNIESSAAQLDSTIDNVDLLQSATLGKTTNVAGRLFQTSEGGLENPDSNVDFAQYNWLDRSLLCAAEGVGK